MQPVAPTFDVQLELPALEATARKWATRTRALVNRAVCDDQEHALTVAAIQFDSAAQFLGHGDVDKARDALRIAANYAGSEEASAPRIAEAASTLLAAIPT
ncbi:hypothetical protein ACFYW8_10665 [Streptomyces sp. NPDC002742]|uniref:hypothetical protein n=1 Tax=Streptomyces sp. NPDC002742 TaxID=3364663 RepID=UPI00368BAB1F